MASIESDQGIDAGDDIRRRYRIDHLFDGLIGQDTAGKMPGIGPGGILGKAYADQNKK